MAIPLYELVTEWLFTNGLSALHLAVSSGAYGAGEGGLAALVDDIEYVCTLWRVGTSKGKVTAGLSIRIARSAA